MSSGFEDFLPKLWPRLARKDTESSRHRERDFLFIIPMLCLHRRQGHKKKISDFKWQVGFGQARTFWKLYKIWLIRFTRKKTVCVSPLAPWICKHNLNYPKLPQLSLGLQTRESVWTNKPKCPPISLWPCQRQAQTPLQTQRLGWRGRKGKWRASVRSPTTTQKKRA